MSFDFFLSAGAASALPEAFPLLLQQLDLDDFELHDFSSLAAASVDFSAEAEALAEQQLPPFLVDEVEEHEDFSVIAFSSFVLVVDCAFAATPTNATKANNAKNFFILFFVLMDFSISYVLQI